MCNDKIPPREKIDNPRGGRGCFACGTELAQTHECGVKIKNHRNNRKKPTMCIRDLSLDPSGQRVGEIGFRSGRGGRGLLLPPPSPNRGRLSQAGPGATSGESPNSLKGGQRLSLCVGIKKRARDKAKRRESHCQGGQCRSVQPAGGGYQRLEVGRSSSTSPPPMPNGPRCASSVPPCLLGAGRHRGGGGGRQ